MSKPAFRKLDPKVRRRLEERGIDIERNFELFQAEIRVMPPPRLLADLGFAPILEEQAIDRIGGGLSNCRGRNSRRAD